MNYKVSIVIEKDDYGYYAFCPELEGCQSQGTPRRGLTNIREAIELYLETMSEEEIILHRLGKNVSALFSLEDLQSSRKLKTDWIMPPLTLPSRSQELQYPGNKSKKICPLQ